jgi:hypothetical protein
VYNSNSSTRSYKYHWWSTTWICTTISIPGEKPQEARVLSRFSSPVTLFFPSYNLFQRDFVNAGIDETHLSEPEFQV